MWRKGKKKIQNIHSSLTGFLLNMSPCKNFFKLLQTCTFLIPANKYNQHTKKKLYILDHVSSEKIKTF